jgi:assimilatory nitrate reductase catalytic subunit
VHDGKIKALWIMGTNPAVSMPDAAHVAAALRRCDFVAVSDVVQDTETTAFADVLLPAMAWGEKDGTVTNTERRISRQRRFSRVVGEAHADWRIICDVASAMGFAGFHYAHAGEIFAEHVALTQYKNNGTRRLDLSHSSGENYDLMSPRQWGGERPFSDGLFQTDDGRARFVPTVFAPSHAIAETLTLNTGRMRDQWHTMTRTGLVPKLFSHRAEPYIEISPGDAKRQGLEVASIAEVVGAGGTSLARVLVTDAVADGAVFQPMHWSKPFAAQSLTNVAVRAERDPFSGQPALKSSRVMIRPYKAAWYGCGVSLTAANPTAGYWAAVPLTRGLSFECADKTTPDNWLGFLARHVALDELVLATVAASTFNSFRCVGYKDGRLAFAFFASDTPVAVNRRWLQQQLGSSSEPHLILAGRPPADVPDQGPIVCACNGVGRYVVAAAASSGVSLTMVCEKTTAGMGCGACRPEIMRIIADAGLTRIAAE